MDFRYDVKTTYFWQVAIATIASKWHTRMRFVEFGCIAALKSQSLTHDRGWQSESATDLSRREIVLTHICHPARRITRVYPVYIHVQQLRWVYAGKINGRLVYGVYPPIPPCLFTSQFWPSYYPVHVKSPRSPSITSSLSLSRFKTYLFLESFLR